MRDLVGLSETAPLPTGVPEDSRIDGFENNAAGQTFTDKHLSVYVDTAEAVTTALLADVKRRDAVVACSPTVASRDACTRTFVTRFGRRAFRRPLLPAEVDALVQLAATEADPWSGVQLAAQAMLTSSTFLFLVESGTPDPRRPGVVTLTGYEVATRLAFLLLGTGPGDALLDAAAAGKLDSADGVAAQARELLADPRAGRARRAFFTQWMQLDDLENVSPDAKRYPAFNAELRASMMEETARFFEDLSARASGNLLDFVTADATFVDAVLARLYGVPAPAAGWARQTMPAGQRGAGVLTQASLLTLTTPHDGVEPIKRGQFVRTALLCQRLPPPPPNVPPLEAAQVPATATPRERLSAHRENPACGGCHQLLDPIGFGLARFDGVGAYRDKDAHGNPIDARGSIAGFTTPDFDGPRELGDRLRGAPEVSRCVATQLFRHATARTESDDDRCLIDRIDDSFRRGGQGWGALVEATVRSDAFRMRRIPETAGGAP